MREVKHGQQYGKRRYEKRQSKRAPSFTWPGGAPITIALSGLQTPIAQPIAHIGLKRIICPGMSAPGPPPPTTMGPSDPPGPPTPSGGPAPSGGPGSLRSRRFDDSSTSLLLALRSPAFVALAVAVRANSTAMVETLMVCDQVKVGSRAESSLDFMS